MTLRKLLCSRAPVIIGLSCVLGACGHTSKQNSQVVARVNDQDITVLQLQRALEMAGVEAATPEAVRTAIDSLVDEELLVQQAQKMRINQDPEIVQALEESRRRLLAQAYAQRVLYPKSSVNLAEEERYYRDNPALFENRRIYRITVFSVQNADMNDRLRADLETSHSVDEVRDVLEKHEIKFETQQLNSAAEELPLDKLEQFFRAKVGDLLIGEQHGGKTLLMSVAAVEERPITFEHAKPLIERYLITMRNTHATEAYLKQAKQMAKITYSRKYIESALPGSRPPGTDASRDGTVAAADGHAQSGVTSLN